jgi:aldose 1-epimerase
MSVEVTRVGALPATGAAFERVEISVGAMRLRLLTLGAAIESLMLPDATGRTVNVHLTLPDPQAYSDPAVNPHLGSTIGRYANRIAGAAFTLDDVVYSLDHNQPEGTLHGGAHGWDRCIWTLDEVVVGESMTSVSLGLVSPAGDQGFPGQVRARTTYILGPDSLRFEHEAVTDSPTVVSMTNHGYWNLSGEPTVLDHILEIAADRILPGPAGGIPTGRPVAVPDAYDLRSGRRIGDVLADLPEGLDHCYDVGPEGVFRHVATLTAPTTGLTMSVSSDAPGVQVYTGNSLRAPFRTHQSVSLETQRMPDAPNQPWLGPCVLRPGETYRSQTALHFAHV